MTSGNVNNFVSDLVLMAKAMEELPQIKTELEQARNERNEYQALVGRREESILEYKAEVERLNAKVRTVEAERDDAELRFLESEDRVSSALNFIKGTFGSAGSLIQALEPPTPVAVPTPPAEPEVIYQPNAEGHPSWANPNPGGQLGEDGVRTEEDVKPSAPYTAEQALADPAKRHDMFPEAVYYEKADATIGQSAVDPTASSAQLINPTDASTATTEAIQSTVESAVPATSGESASPPTSACPVPPTGTGTEPAASSSDPEPEPKWTKTWWNWHERNRNVG